MSSLYDWQTKKLTWLFKLISSGTTPPSNKDEYYDKEIAWLNTGDLTDDYIEQPTKFISKRALREFPTLKIYPKNSLIMAMYGATIGKLGITKFETTTNQACCVLSEPVGVDIKFIFYWLMGHREEIIQLSQGGGQPNISQGIIKSIRLPIPDLRVQSLIAEFLERKFEEINRLLTSKENLITLLEEKRQSMITEAVTKGLNPNVKMKDSGVEWIGEIPEHWIISPLKFLSSQDKNSFVDGPFGSDLKNEEYVEEGIPVIQLNNIRDSLLRFNKINYVSQEKADQLSRHTAYPGDLVIAKMASPVARSAIVTNDYEKYIIVADCIRLKLRKEYNNEFINYAINTRHVISQAESFASGTTRSRVNLSIVKNLKIIVPPLNEQIAIVDYLKRELKSINRVINSISEQIEKLKEYRQSLIYEAVTGKIDVRDFEVDS